MNFGGLRRAIVKQCLGFIIEGKESIAKDTLIEFIDYVKSKQPLYAQYFVYDNLLNHTETDKDVAIMFIKETLSQLRGLITYGDVLTFNTLLKHKFGIKEQSTNVDKAIHTLIENTVSDFTINTAEVSSAFKIVLEHIMKEKTKGNTINELISRRNQFNYDGIEYFTPKKIVRIAMKKMNEEFGPLFTNAERKLFKQIMKSDDLISIYESQFKQLKSDIATFKNKCKDLDDDLINNIDKAKDKLENADANLDNLLDMVELREQLVNLTNNTH